VIFLFRQMIRIPTLAQSPDEIGRALDAIAVAKVEAVNVLASPILNAARRLNY
jgi:hypothetical protein